MRTSSRLSEEWHGKHKEGFLVGGVVQGPKCGHDESQVRRTWFRQTWKAGLCKESVELTVSTQNDEQENPLSPSCPSTEVNLHHLRVAAPRAG